MTASPTGIRSELSRFVLIHFAFALLLNLPALMGRVPLPIRVVDSFPSWFGVPEAQVPAVDGRGISDLATQIYPWRVLASDSFREGRLPLWNAHVLGGTPFVANSQSAIFYPFNWLYLLLPPPAAWTILFIVRTALAGLFTTLFIRRLGANAIASVCSGIVFTACGFITAWRGYPMGDAAIWLPLACLATLLLSERPTNRSVILAAIAYSMPVLAGHPETAAHIAIVIGFFALYVLLQTPPDERRRYLLLFVAAGILSLGLAAAQMLPTVEWLDYTHQSLDENWPPQPFSNAVTLVSRDIRTDPTNVGVSIPEGAGYPGIVALLFILSAFAGSLRKSAIFFGAAAIVAASVVYGLDPFHWLSTVVPILSGLKNGRLLLVVDFSIAILLGLGLTHLQTARTFVLHTRLILTSALLAFAALWYAGSIQTPSPFIRSSGFTALLIGMVVLGALHLASSKIQSRTLSFGILGVAAVDALIFSAGFVPFAETRSLYPNAPIFDYLRTHTDPSNRIGVIDDAIPVNIETMYGLRGLNGYDIPLRMFKDAFVDFSERDVTGVVLHAGRVGALMDHRLDLMAVKYLVTSNINGGAARLPTDDGRFVLAHSEGDARIFENRNALRTATLIPARSVETIPTRWRQLYRLKDPAFDPATMAFVGADLPATSKEQANALEPRIQEITRPSAETIQIKADVAEPSLLVLSESFYPGWKARVDGIEQPVHNVNFMVMGVPLAPGSHAVTFEFVSPVVYAGMAVSVLAAFSALVLWLHGRRRPFSWKILMLAVVVPAIALSLAATTIQRNTFRDTQLGEIELSRSIVSFGESYVLRIASLPNAAVRVRYSVDGGEIAEFETSLDGKGEVKFDITPTTPKGDYKLISFRRAGDGNWTDSEVTIRVK